jgi:Tfp pilus assembly protein PilN
MRPINLIPPQDRRTHGAAARTGPLAYIVVGSLAVLLIGVVMLVLISNQISDREGEVESLEGQRAVATAKAAELTPYVSFEQVATQRTTTVTELADSRFDWVRIVRQLSLILPKEVFVTDLTAAGAGAEGSTGFSVAGPSMTIAGCAPGQDKVAAFVASLKQIDGVTRVGLSNSSLSGKNQASEGCGANTFNLTVAFDEAPVASEAGGVITETPTEAPVEGEAAEEGEAAAESAAPEGAAAPEAEPPTEGTVSSTAPTEGSAG